MNTYTAAQLRKSFPNAAENTLCRVNFLPHIFDSSAKERKRYLKMIKEVMMEKAGLPIKHFWTEGNLRIYPTVTAID
jgi:hypothetical protein